MVCLNSAQIQICFLFSCLKKLNIINILNPKCLTCIGTSCDLFGPCFLTDFVAISAFRPVRLYQSRSKSFSKQFALYVLKIRDSVYQVCTSFLRLPDSELQLSFTLCSHKLSGKIEVNEGYRQLELLRPLKNNKTKFWP